MGAQIPWINHIFTLNEAHRKMATAVRYRTRTAPRSLNNPFPTAETVEKVDLAFRALRPSACLADGLPALRKWWGAVRACVGHGCGGGAALRDRARTAAYLAATAVLSRLRTQMSQPS